MNAAATLAAPLADATVTIDGVTGPASIGQSLFDCAEVLGVNVSTSCHKQGKCRECLVEIEQGGEFLSAPTRHESHLEGRFRLACRTQVAAAGEVRCHTLRRGSLRIETESQGLPAATLELDPSVTRDGRHVLLDGVAIAEADGPLHGLAIDLGTTTVALRLHDLESGRLIATLAFENPQRFGGTDVLARIHYDGLRRGRLLQRTLLGYLAHSIESLPVDPLSIYELVVVGNPTMRDLLFGLDVQSLGVLPYRSVTEAAVFRGRATGTSLAATGRKLRLPVHPAARVYGAPLVGSHVGADAAACLLATNLAAGAGLRALLDIGTNTEVFLGNAARLLAASCPAGPAFEGGATSCGMPALDGAIERVRLHGDGTCEVKVINDGVPAGVCGSGLVDVLAELRRTRRMSEQGRFAEAGERIALAAEHGVFLSETDVSELAQAKGATAAGLRVLADVLGTGLDRIERLYLAGGFAQHIDVDAACRIGLIPDLPRDRIVKVGNAALLGASMALLSHRHRVWIERIVRRVELVRLEAHPQFFEYFVQGCQFVPFGGAA